MLNFLKQKRWILGASLLAAVGVFLFLLQLEKKELSDYETLPVVTAKEEVPEGLVLTEENVNAYFQVQEVNQAHVAGDTFQKTEDLCGKLLKITISPGTLVYDSMLLHQDALLAQMLEPVEVSFQADDISQVVGGILREGDFIDVYVVDGETGASEEILTKAYVKTAFDSSGKAVERIGKNQPALVINLILEKAQAGFFHEKLNQGSIRVCKTGYPYEPKAAEQPAEEASAEEQEVPVEETSEVQKNAEEAAPDAVSAPEAAASVTGNTAPKQEKKQEEPKQEEGKPSEKKEEPQTPKEPDTPAPAPDPAPAPAPAPETSENPTIEDLRQEAGINENIGEEAWTDYMDNILNGGPIPDDWGR